MEFFNNILWILIRLIVLGFNNTSILVGHFVSSPREREKRERERRIHRGDERKGQGRKRNRNESEETEDLQCVTLKASSKILFEKIRLVISCELSGISRLIYSDKEKQNALCCICHQHFKG